MCYAYNAISKQIQDLNNELGRLREDLSHHDKAISGFNHELEAMDFNQTEGYNLARSLQEILLRRRRIKYEMHQIRSLKAQLENVEFKLKENEKNFEKDKPNNWQRLIHMNHSEKEITAN